jgi:prefoldin subunit 5
MEVIIFTLLVVIIILLIWDTYFLKRLLTKHKTGSQVVDLEKYYELKYNINLIKSLATIFIFILGFLGYNSYNSLKGKIEDEVASEIELYKKEINKHKDEISQIEDSLNYLNESLDKLRNFKNDISEDIMTVRQQVSELNNRVNQTKDAFKTSPKIYVVKNYTFPYDLKNQPKSYHIKFNELKTFKGEKIKSFKTPPAVFTVSDEGEFKIMEITNTGFVMKMVDIYDIQSKYNLDIWIASYR